MSEENVVATFTISGNTPSSKNNRMWTGSSFIPSAYTRRWLRDTKTEWEDQRDAFVKALEGLPKPYCIEFTFVRKSRHKFDNINITQGPADCMKAFGWLEDDNADILKPYYGDYTYDKRNPRLIIKILKQAPNHYDIPSHKTTS